MSDRQPTTTRKRLSLCITDLEVGGAERCLVEIATRIDRTEFSPTVYCLAARPPAGPRSLAERLEAADVPVQFLNAASKKDVWRTIGQLTRAWRADRPDVVQSFLFHANIVSRVAARRARVPAVVSGLRVAERRGRWRLRIDRWTARLVDRHVCVSQAVANFSTREGGLPADRVVVIPNGIDAELYRNASPADVEPLGVQRGGRVILFVGRLDRQKGIDWLLESAAAWNDRLARHHILLVGDGPLRAELERQSESLGIARRVHFAGWRDDVPRLLAASDLLVLPSRWEGMPNVVLEAMAAGQPVVASDVEGVGQLLGPSADAQTVSFGNTQDFVNKVVAISESSELRARLGRENAARAVAVFTIDRMVEQYERLFRDLSRG